MDVQYQRYKLNAWELPGYPSKLIEGGRVYVRLSRITRNDKNFVHWHVPFTCENRKFGLENQIVRVIPFNKDEKYGVLLLNFTQ